MSSLALAAWPAEIRPRPLDGISAALATVGITPGIPVFIGSKKPLEAIIESECLVVHGIDAQGARVKLHPVERCPNRGLKWIGQGTSGPVPCIDDVDDGRLFLRPDRKAPV